MKFYNLITLLFSFFLVVSASAETLETNFYDLELPEKWRAARAPSGLWTVGPQDEETGWKLSVARLRGGPELYFQNIARLWDRTGEVHVLKDESDGANGLIVFEIVPREGSDPTLKFCRWNIDLVWVASSTFPVERRAKVLEMGRRFTGNMEFSSVEFDPAALKSEIARVLKNHQATEGVELDDLRVVRTEMTSFRQDWEPYFPHSKPPIYEAFRKYLEARFDASFAINNAEQMGMPQSLIDSRVDSVSNRRAELLPLLEEEFRWSDEGL